MAHSKHYHDGYATGAHWTDTYRPGGPFVFPRSPGKRAAEDLLHRESAIRNQDWLEGFDAARAERRLEALLAANKLGVNWPSRKRADALIDKGDYLGALRECDEQQAEFEMERQEKLR